MSRERRKWRRKQRRREPVPEPRPVREPRDPRTRWLGLSSRGGLRLSFVPTGSPLPGDPDGPGAEAVQLLVERPGPAGEGSDPN